MPPLFEGPLTSESEASKASTQLIRLTSTDASTEPQARKRAAEGPHTRRGRPPGSKNKATVERETRDILPVTHSLFALFAWHVHPPLIWWTHVHSYSIDLRTEFYLFNDTYL